MSSSRPCLPALRATVLAGTLAFGACADDPTTLSPDLAVEEPALAVLAPPSAGSAAFASECAGCHASRDGFDLAYFGFPDSTIIRRAVFHVDSSTARAIVGHVRSLDVHSVGRDTRPFQVPLAASDEDFAVRLFGDAGWPSDLDEEGLLGIDPSLSAAAVSFPVWSDEGSNLDWMPGAPLPAEVLGPPDGRVARSLDAYTRRRSDQTLVRAVQHLRRAAVDPVTGPCFQSEDGALRDPAVCFETTRWTSSLGGQHALRAGLDLRSPVSGSTAIADAFWDVGQAARRGLLRNEAPVDHAEENWVTWMYMGWVLAPGNHASVYTASGLARAGLPRHGTFVALRSMVARREHTHQAFADLSTAARVAPSDWLMGAYTTGLSVLEARMARGWAPESDVAIAEATQALERAATVLVRRLGRRDAEPMVARTRLLIEAL